MIKSVGFIYDTQSDYDIKDAMVFSDFCYESEMRYITGNLIKSGFDVTIFKGFKELSFCILQGKINFDLIFNKFEGFKSRNREGLVPSFLELFGIPFIGTDAYGLSLSLDKFQVKLLCEYFNICTPKFILIKNTNDYSNIKNFKMPFVIKPNSEGSSMGVHLIRDISCLTDKFLDDLTLSYGFPLLCEEYIEGNEVSIPIIGTDIYAKALGAVEFKKIMVIFLVYIQQNQNIMIIVRH